MKIILVLILLLALSGCAGKGLRGKDIPDRKKFECSEKAVESGK